VRAGETGWGAEFVPTIIPSPGEPGVTPNVSATIELSQDYVVAAGATLYAEAVPILFRTAGLQGDYYDLVSEGTLWNRGAHYASLVDTYNFASIVNHGLAVAEATAGNAQTFTVGSHFEGLANSGRIFALATGGSATAVEDWASTGIDIVNSGLIAARGQFRATAVSRWNGGEVFNTAGASILAEGADAIAVFLGRGHFNPDGLPGLVDIDNRGLIEAVSTDPAKASAAIYTDSLSVESITIANWGTIRGDYAIIGSGNGSSPVQKAPQTVLNHEGGLIEGVIDLELGDDLIVNQGVMAGYVDLGAGDDRFDTSLGYFIGLADLGWGDDGFAGGAYFDAALGGRGQDGLQGGSGSDLLLGGRGDDELAGDGGNDGLYGEGGNDRLLTRSGDRALAGVGDDEVVLGDYAFARVEGGGGRDTLTLPTAPRLLDLSAALASGRIADFDEIRLTGAQELVIRPGDVAALTGGAELRVSAAGGGKVGLVGAWTAGPMHVVDGAEYRSYASGGARVLVEVSADVVLLAVAPSGAAGLDAVAAGPAAPLPGAVPGAELAGSVTVGNYVMQSSLVVDSDETWISETGPAVLGSSDASFTLVNHGRLESRGGADGANVLAFYVLRSIDNYGTIHASASGNGDKLEANRNLLDIYGIDNMVEALQGNVHALNSGGHGADIYNAGTISASSEASVATGYNSWSLNFHNAGDITARSSAFVAVGIYAHNGGRLVNDGTIEAFGDFAGYGVRSSTHAATFENNGLIAAAVARPGTQSIGVSFYYQTGVSTLVNTDTIRADIAVQSSWMVNGGGLRLINTGHIDGLVQLNVNPNGGAARTDLVVNSGLIDGEVRLGGERDFYLGFGGTQLGAVLGEGGADLLFGTSGADSLSGGEGADLIAGGLGADTLTGGSEADLFLYRSTADSDSAGIDIITDFQPGADRLDLSALGVTSLSLTPGAGHVMVEGTTAGGAVRIQVNGAIGQADVIVSPPIPADATDGPDMLWGNPAGGPLNGGGGDDLLFGGDGGDRIDGGTGADILLGGRGNDLYVVDRDDDILIELAGGGHDSIEVNGGGYTMPYGVEDLRLVAGEWAVGNGLGNRMTGNAGLNHLTGGGGADILIGRGGEDVLDGGDGADTFLYELLGDAQDTIYFFETGLDRLDFSAIPLISIELNTTPANEFVADRNLLTIATTTGSATLTIMGRMAMSDIVWSGGRRDLVGTAVNDSLTGGGGDDSLRGLSGNDRLDGGLGSDRMEGGTGNDSYVVDNAGDELAEAGAAGGADTVLSSVHFALGANFENLILTGQAAIDGTGNALANNLAGNAAANVLDGGAGADTMTGGGGDDFYRVDQAADRVVELAGGGVDTLSAPFSLTLPGQVENLVLAGAAAINGTGNALANALTGNAAANVLNGGAGADLMAGGAGHDVYHVDSSGDRVVEAAGAGADLVSSLVSFVLPSEVENLALAGGAAINGTGNALANALTGNAAANVLDGGAGADRMTGGGGDDLYHVDSAGDRGGGRRRRHRPGLQPGQLHAHGRVRESDPRRHRRDQRHRQRARQHPRRQRRRQRPERGGGRRPDDRRRRQRSLSCGFVRRPGRRTAWRRRRPGVQHRHLHPSGRGRGADPGRRGGGQRHRQCPRQQPHRQRRRQRP
jgi:Ca2+-binding RTX toxin-like protein